MSRRGGVSRMLAALIATTSRCSRRHATGLKGFTSVMRDIEVVGSNIVQDLKHWRTE